MKVVVGWAPAPSVFAFFASFCRNSGIELLALILPIVVALMVLAAFIHAWFVTRKPAPPRPLFRPAVVIVCLLHLAIAAWVCWHLYTGGWLTTTTYHWNDPDDINLVLAIFEPLCAAAVFTLPIARTRYLYKLLINLLIIQSILAAAFLALILVFVLTWHPRML